MKEHNTHSEFEIGVGKEWEIYEPALDEVHDPENSESSEENAKAKAKTELISFCFGRLQVSIPSKELTTVSVACLGCVAFIGGLQGGVILPLSSCVMLTTITLVKRRRYRRGQEKSEKSRNKNEEAPRGVGYVIRCGEETRFPKKRN